MRVETYYPAPGSAWELRPPESQRLDPDLLAAALGFASHQFADWSTQLAELRAAAEQEGYGGIIGPLKARGDFNALILRDGFIVAEVGDTERVDMCFSVSKSFLGLVAGLAVDQRLIRDVHDRVADYVDDGNFSGPHNSGITWHHLLQQTSEWEGSLWGKPYTIEQPPSHTLQAPGAVLVHNDVRVNLLSLELLRVWRRALPDVLREHVMDPIGASTGWHWRGYGNSAVEIDGRHVESVSGGGHWGGGLFINTRDLARVAYLLLRRGRWGNRQIISPTWVDRMLTPCTVEPTYGYTIWLNTQRKLWPSAPEESFAFRGHGSTVVWIDPRDELVVALRWINWHSVDAILHRILRSILP